MAKREDFTLRQREILARRAGGRCSNPQCGAPTFGPQMHPERALNVGVAAHITAAAPGGPRYEIAMSTVERTSLENAVWLCQNCAKLVDNDPLRFTVRLLRRWKAQADQAALEVIAQQAAHGDRRTAAPDEPLTPIRTYWIRVPQAQFAASLAAHLGLNPPRGFRFVEEAGDLVPHGSYIELDGGVRMSFSWPDIRSAVTRLCRDHAAPLLEEGFLVSAFVASQFAECYGADHALPRDEPIHILLEKLTRDLRVTSSQDLVDALTSYAFELPAVFDRSHLNALPSPSPSWDVLAELIRRQAWSELKRCIVEVASISLGIATLWVCEIVRLRTAITDPKIKRDLDMAKPRDAEAIRTWAESLLGHWAEVT